MEKIPSTSYDGNDKSFSNAYLCNTDVNMSSSTENGETALFSATRRTDEQEVRSLTKAGADVNHTDVFGNTALIIAAGTGAVNIVHVLKEANCYIDHENIAEETALLVACNERHSTSAKTLIDFGASVNKADRSGRTPLMAAAQAGCSENIKHLINASADLNVRNRKGMTALMMASVRDDAECLDLLLAAGADADAKDNKDLTSLMLASREGKLRCVKALLLHGVNKNAINKDGMSALMLAASEGQSECLLTLMLAGCDAKIKDKYGNTFLILATIHNKLTCRCVTSLSSHWVDINAKNNDGMTALMFATPDSHQDVLQQLLMVGASTDLKNAKGNTALMIASKFDKFNAVNSLINFNADINIIDNSGNNALLLAAGRDSVGSLRCLVEKGANLEHDNARGETALMVAAKHGSSRCLEVLLRNHAEIDHQSKKTGMTALMLAVEHDHVDCFKQLIQGGAKLELQNQESKTALMISIEEGMYRRFSDLLKAGASVHAANEDGQTPLMLAAAVPDKRFVRRLLQAVSASGQYTGVYVNTKDKHDNTALKIAAEKGFYANVEVLVQYGAEVNMVNDKGESPVAGHGGCIGIPVSKRGWFMNDENGQKALMRAIVLGQTDIVEALTRTGGNVNLPDQLGRTPLMLATGFRQTEIVELLLRRGAYVDQTDRDGNTALMFTFALIHTFDVSSLDLYLGINDISNQDQDRGTRCFRLLRKAHANINKTNNRGRTAVMLAAMSRRADSAAHLRLLLANGADLNAQDRGGSTALMHAVENISDDECVLALLEAYANVDTQDIAGHSALMLARSYKHLIYLLAENADVNLTDNEGQTALMAVAGKRRLLCSPSNNYQSLFSLLTGSTSGIDAQDNQGETALMKASSAGNKDHIKSLLRNGANVNIQDHNGRTALAHSTMYCPVPVCISSKIAKLLVDHGSDVNVQDKNGMTTLMMASSKGMGKTVQKLLDCGANVNIQDHTGKTSLMHAVIPNQLNEEDSDDEEEACVSTVNRLINHEADVNMKDVDGRTALMHAARCTQRYSYDLISPLAGHQSCIDLLDNEGKSALTYALENCKSNEESITVYLLLINDAFPKVKVTNTSVLNAPSSPRFLTNILQYCDDYEDVRAVTRLLVSNNIAMPIMQVGHHWNRHESNDKEEWSPLLQLCEIFDGDPDIAKYLIANCYLTTTDMDRIRSDDLPDSLKTDAKDFLKDALAKPWPLVKLAQITVSTAIGPSPGREQRIRQTGLPRPIMDCLMFDRPIALLHDDWEDIPMCFDPQEYAQLPSPYPLLYKWPFGHKVMPCDCHVCNEKEENFRFTKIFEP